MGDPRWLKRPWEIDDDASRSAISVPLFSAGKLKGVLTAVHQKPGQFTPNDLALLVTIAGLVSLNGKSSSSAKSALGDPHSAL
jgi:GAF domain-containing protein